MGLLTLSLAQAHAQILDGSFEDPHENVNVTTFGAGSTFGAWNVTAGNIDIVTDATWQAHSGTQSVDLSGTTAGTISQTITDVAGDTYSLDFYLAGNYGDLPTVKTVIASAGSSSGTYTFDTTGHDGGNMGWTLMSLTFTGSGSDLIQFASQDNTDAGPALDDVSVQLLPMSTPEPGTYALLASSVLTGAAFLRRKQSRKAA